ncbi:MAG: DUF1080 domain-containing protein [Planctomycetota bacterium]
MYRRRATPAVSRLLLATLVVGLIVPSVVVGGDPVSLFDGKTLKGWTSRGKHGKATFRVEDGVIVGRTAPNSRNTFLCTDRHYSDFELELEFKIDGELNGGIQIRSHAPKGFVTGYQVEIDPDTRRNRMWTGGIYDENRRGWIHDLSKNEEARNAFRPDEWNELKIRAVGCRLQTWVNGVPAADHLDAMTLSGFIGLQVHGVGKREDPLEVRWRNIRIEELGAHRWRSLLHDVAVPGEAESLTAKATPATLQLGSTATSVLTWPEVEATSDYALRLAYRNLAGGVHARWPGGVRQVELPRPDGDGTQWLTLLGGNDRAKSEPRQPVASVTPPVESGPGGALVLREESRVSFERIERLVPVTIQPTLGAPAPAGATQLIGPSTGFERWRRSDAEPPIGWKFENGDVTVVPGTGSIETVEEYEDFGLHLEFMTVDGDCNSGVYLQRRYEVQILGAHQHPGESNGCASLYRFRRPDIAVARPAGEWQSYDIEFRAPRWSDGKKIEPARITVVHNGVIVHDNVVLSRKTGAGRAEGPKPGPIQLQDHGAPIRYRNVWIERR